MILTNNDAQDPLNGEHIMVDSDQYQYFTDLFFDSLWYIENLVDEDKRDIYEELHHFAKSRLCAIENQWRYARYQDIRDGKAPNRYIR